MPISLGSTYVQILDALPADPTAFEGRLVYVGGVVYVSDGIVWSAAGSGGGGGLDIATADARYVNADGDTMDGDLLVSHEGPVRIIAESRDGSAYLVAVSPVGQPALVVLGNQEDGTIRWVIGKGGSMEGGGNTGSDFSVVRFDDAGNVLSEPLTIDRSTGRVLVDQDPVEPMGLVTKQYLEAHAGSGGGLDQATADARYVNVAGADSMEGPLTLAPPTDPAMIVLNTVAGQEKVIFYRTAGEPRWSFGAEFDTDDGSNTGLFSIGRYDDNGDWQSNPISIARASGLTTFANSVEAQGPVDLTAAQGTNVTSAVRKDYVDARTPRITVSTTAPASPTVGSVWIDSN